MTQPTTLFLDIDGVFTMMDCLDLKIERVGGIHCRPIPMANALLQVIHQHKSINPAWLSSWDLNSLSWNERADIDHWPVAFRMTEEDESFAQLYFTEMYTQNMDKKLIAAHFFLWKTHCGTDRVVWMEDGFAPETVAWAKERNNKIAETILIDTTKEPIRSELLSTYEDYEQAAKTFMGRYVL